MPENKEVTDGNLFIRSSKDEMVVWDRLKIINALKKETGISDDIAEDISYRVQDIIEHINVDKISTALIRELVNVELIRAGHMEARNKHISLGIPIYDVNELMLHPNKENANVPHGPEATNLNIAERIKKEYALEKVFSQDVAKAHINGDIHLHDLGFVDRPYTYMGDESIIVKDALGNIRCMSFKTLFDACEIMYNTSEDDVFIGMLKNWLVLDKDTWVSIKRVVKRLKTRQMYWVKTTNSRSLIVTDNHPFMIFDSNQYKKVLACDLVEGQKIHSITKLDITSNMSSIDLTAIDLCNNNANRVYYLNNVIIDGYDGTKEIINDLKVTNYRKLMSNGYVIDIHKACIYSKAANGNTASNKLSVVLELNEDFCYMVGLFIAEGHYEKSGISFTCNKSFMPSIVKVLELLNVHYTLCDHGDNGCKRLRAYSTILHDMFLNYFKIGKKSRTTCLPDSVISWKPELAFSLLCGIIDGDGTRSGNNILIRVSSRQMLNQINWLLMSQGIKSSDNKNGGSGSVREYKGKIIIQNYDIFGISFGIFSHNRYLFKNSVKCREIENISKICSKEVDCIKKVCPIDIQDDYIYDITTESGTFMCNGIYSSNCSGNNLAYIAKYGLSLNGSMSNAKPAKKPEALLAHMVKFSAALQGCFAGAIGWDAINVFFAPYIVDKTHDEVMQLAQMLIFEFSQQAVARGGQAIFSDINIYWEIPNHFKDVKAISPGGKETGLVYGDYLLQSQRLATALFEVYLEGDKSGRPFFFPKPIVHITEKFYKTVGHRKFLELICKVSVEKGNTYFVFDRGKTAKISECCFHATQWVKIRKDGYIINDIIANICTDSNIAVEIYHKGIFKLAHTVKTVYSKFVKVILDNGATLFMTDNHLCPCCNKDDLVAKRTSITKDKKSRYLTVDDYLPVFSECDNGEFKDEYIKIKSIEFINYKYPIPVYCFKMDDQNLPYFTLANGVETHNCRLSFKLNAQDLEDAKTPWKLRFCAIQNITINLPRIAYKAKGNNEDIKVFELLDEVFATIVEAHMQKDAFIKKLLDLGRSGPQSLLVMNLDGEPYLRIDKVSYLVGLLGLNEAVKSVTGKEMYEDESAYIFGLKIINHLKNLCEEYTKNIGMKFVLEQTPAESTAYRLARLDMKYYPELASKAVQGDIASGEIYYTNSTQFPVKSSINFIERINKEGMFHPLIEAGSISHIWLGTHKPDEKVIANLITKIFKNTLNDQVAISPEFTICNVCNKTERGLRDECLSCGSTDVDGITRITGYFSHVSNWNKGKKSELKDRVRENI